jgi:hypothetical protein
MELCNAFLATGVAAKASDGTKKPVTDAVLTLFDSFSHSIGVAAAGASSSTAPAAALWACPAGSKADVAWPLATPPPSSVVHALDATSASVVTASHKPAYAVGKVLHAVDGVAAAAEGGAIQRRLRVAAICVGLIDAMVRDAAAFATQRGVRQGVRLCYHDVAQERIAQMSASVFGLRSAAEFTTRVCYGSSSGLSDADTQYLSKLLVVQAHRALAQCTELSEALHERFGATPSSTQHSRRYIAELLTRGGDGAEGHAATLRDIESQLVEGAIGAGGSGSSAPSRGPTSFLFNPRRGGDVPSLPGVHLNLTKPSTTIVRDHEALRAHIQAASSTDARRQLDAATPAACTVAGALLSSCAAAFSASAALVAADAEKRRAGEMSDALQRATSRWLHAQVHLEASAQERLTLLDEVKEAATFVAAQGDFVQRSIAMCAEAATTHPLSLPPPPAAQKPASE